MPAELREILEQQMNAEPATAEVSPEKAAPPAGEPAPEKTEPAGGEDYSDPNKVQVVEPKTEAEAEPEAKPAQAEQTEQDKQVEAEARRARVDRAPSSWTNENKATWSTLPLSVRQEVYRREQHVTQVLEQNAQYRKILSEVQEIASPYQARLQQMGTTPAQALGRFLQADHVLSSAPKLDRAQFVAKLIRDYDVDIAALDDALSGQVEPATKQANEVERLLQQKLAPFNQYMQQMQQQQAKAAQQQQQAVQAEVERMSQDSVNYPYFNELRMDMADFIDVMQKRGQTITLDQAYRKAVAMNPDLFQQVANQQASAAIRTQAQQINGAAAKAANAAVSVSGAPGVGVVAPNPNDLRGLLETQFNAASTGRV